MAVCFRSHGFAVSHASTLASLLTEVVRVAAANSGKHAEKAAQLQTGYQWSAGRSFAHVVVKPRAGVEPVMLKAEMKKVQKLLEVLLREERPGNRNRNRRLQYDGAWVVDDNGVDVLLEPRPVAAQRPVLTSDGGPSALCLPTPTPSDCEDERQGLLPQRLDVRWYTALVLVPVPVVVVHAVPAPPSQLHATRA